MPDPDALEALLRRFLPTGRFLNAASCGNGNINDSYRVEVELENGIQSYFLQRLNHQVFRNPEALMENVRKVAGYLGAQSYPYRIAVPITALDGQLLQIDNAGNYWRLFPFFENTYAPEGLSDPDIAYEAARAYGAFARALRDFPAAELAETIPGFHDTDQRWAVFLTVLQENTALRADSVQAEIEAMFALKPVFDQISALKNSGALPLRVTHNDTKAGNVLFDTHSHKAVAVIDWDTIMPGTLLSDFGDMARTFVPNVYEDAPAEQLVLRSTVLDALQKGYLEETADFMQPAEKENLLLGAQWISGEQALRFLTDYLAGDVYYKLKYPEHNLVRVRNQLALAALFQSH